MYARGISVVIALNLISLLTLIFRVSIETSIGSIELIFLELVLPLNQLLRFEV